MVAFTTDWEQQSELLTLDGADGLLRGCLHCVLAKALHVKDGVGSLMIRTDSGTLYCTNEIKLLGADNTRPSPITQRREAHSAD